MPPPTPPRPPAEAGSRSSDETLRAELQRHTEMESGLRAALDADEFELQFQPVVDPDGNARGVEALIRWNRPGVRSGVTGRVHPRRRVERPDH